MDNEHNTVENNHTISISELTELVQRVLVAHGTNEESARLVALSVAVAEASGNRICGIGFVPFYCRDLEIGAVDGKAIPVIENGHASVIQVNANHGFAQPAIKIGTEQLIEVAKDTGCAALSIYNSYNCGALGQYTETFTRAGLLAMGFTNSPAAISAPNGIHPIIGTNPIAISIPNQDGEVAFQFDQSSSVVPIKQIFDAAAENEAIPDNWAVDSLGNPTTNAEKALNGSLVSFGGYKGFNIGLLVEVLAGALTGANLSAQAPAFGSKEPVGIGQFFLALSPEAFSKNIFFEKIEHLIKTIKQHKKCKVPGLTSLQKLKNSQKNGIIILSSSFKELQELTIGTIR